MNYCILEYAFGIISGCIKRAVPLVHGNRTRLNEAEPGATDFKTNMHHTL